MLFLLNHISGKKLSKRIGFNYMINGDGRDNIINGTDEDDAINGGDGDDVLRGFDGDDILDAGSGFDRLYGGDGNDILISGAGRNIEHGERPNQITLVNGEAGNDLLLLGEGTFLAYGGADSDVFRIVSVENWSNLAGQLVIEDFDWEDQLDFSQILIEGQPLNFIGEAEFSGTVGEIRIDPDVSNSSGGSAILELDLDGGGIASSFIWLREVAELHEVTLGSNIFETMFRNEVIGTDSADNLTGTIGDDWIRTGFGKDVIEGSSGADIIHGAGELWGAELTFNLSDTNLFDATDEAIIIELYTDRVIGTGSINTLYSGIDKISIDASGSPHADLIDASNWSPASGELPGVFFYGLTLEVDGQFGEGRDRIIGSDYRDFITDGEGASKIEAGAGDDYIFVNLGADYLDGGDGIDQVLYNELTSGIILDLSAGTSSLGDTLINIENVSGTIGDDVIIGDMKDNRIGGYDGDDTLSGSGGGDVIYGGAGDDVIDGGSGSDVLIGGAGNDVFRPADIGSGFSDSTYDGGADIDTFDFGIAEVNLTFAVYIDNPSVVTIADGTVTNVEVFYGGSGDDFFIFSNFSDDVTLYGGAGDDIIEGGSGNNEMTGGLGNDQYIIENGTDLIFENADEGMDSITASASFYLYANIENLALEYDTGDLFGVGNELDNIIEGNAASNLLIGGAGDDELLGNLGVDSLFGQEGADELFGGSGIDYLVGGIGDDMLDGGADADALHGEDGNDTLNGGAGFHTDILNGGAGDDILQGASGLNDYDLMDGGSGNDIYYVDTGADLTFEAVDGGTDTVIADVSNVDNAGVYLYANVENLVLLGSTAFGVGNELDNTLTGSEAANYLLGGAGDDIIAGGAGNDVLFGQAGEDTFLFVQGTGGDVIGDFTSGEDQIDLSDFGFASFAALQDLFFQGGKVGAVRLGDGDLLVLHNVVMDQLVEDDFLL